MAIADETGRMTRISLNDRITRGTAHVETQVETDGGAQTLMMSIQQGNYYALESTAQRIWELTGSPVEVSRIVDTLVAEYDVSRSDCEGEVLAFLDDLARHELIVRVEG